MNKSEANLKVVLTNHAVRRLNERFFVRDQSQIEPVFKRAVVDGFLSSNDGNMSEKLIEHRCLLMAGTFNGDRSFTVETVYNLASGISEKLKEQMWNGKPTPWKSSQVVLPRKKQGDANE